MVGEQCGFESFLPQYELGKSLPEQAFKTQKLREIRMKIVTLSISCVALFASVGQAQEGAKTCPNATQPVAVSVASQPMQEPQKSESKDIVATAASIEDFSTLVAAVKAADLVEVLQGKGPFTVFAPTNEAFAKLPEGTVASLLKPENKDKLVAILKYHVVSGKVMAADVVKVEKAKTVQGQEVSVKVVDGKVMIDGATVVKADVACKNGVIHVIDSVILPKDEK